MSDKPINLCQALEKRARRYAKKGDVDNAVMFILRAAENAETQEERNRLDKQALEWLILADT